MSGPSGEGGGEIDPYFFFGPSLKSFEAGPVSAERLSELREAACINVVVEPEARSPAFEFIIDVSGSMSLTPPNGDKTKWALTREALQESVTNLPADARLGVVYFPNKATERNCVSGEGPCEPGTSLPIDACVNTEGALALAPWGDVESSQRVAFEDSLERVNPANGTPTHDALLFGLQQLSHEDPESQRLLVLLTDGQPTYLAGCRGSGQLTDPVDPAHIVSTIADAADAGIATFVVGAPGSEQTSGGGEDARRWLSDAAIAGRTAPTDCETNSDLYCHHDLSQEENFGDALDDALSTILSQAKPCDFTFPDAPADRPIKRDEVNVLLVFEDGDGVVVGQAKAPCEEGDEGYVLEEVDDEIVGHLCQESCAAYRQSVSVSLELILGCEAAPVRPPH